MFSNAYLIASTALLSLAGAATYMVDVGKNDTLLFGPSSITAAVGDIVEFHFFPKNHSVDQSSFREPCQFNASSKPFFSGFMPVTSGEGVGQIDSDV